MINVFLRAVVFGLGVEAGREAYSFLKSSVVGSKKKAGDEPPRSSGSDEDQVASVQPVEASAEVEPSVDEPSVEEEDEEETEETDPDD